jgi:hypothetical protein
MLANKGQDWVLPPYCGGNKQRQKRHIGTAIAPFGTNVFGGTSSTSPQKIRAAGGQLCAPRRENSSRAGFSDALAPAMIQIDELSGLADVTDDVEPADQFHFRSIKCGSGMPEAFAVGGVF